MSRLSIPFANRLLKQEADWRDLVLTVELVDDTYAFDADLPEEVDYPIATSASLTGLDVSGGYAEAAAAYFAAINDERTIIAAVIVEATVGPIAFIDDIVGFPWVGTPGKPYWLAWQNGRVFRL